MEQRCDPRASRARGAWLLTGRWIICRSSVAGLAALLFLGTPRPALSQQIQLGPKREAQAKSIESQLIAPCCFRQTVAEHQSPAAESIKAEVRQMLAAGATEQQVLDSFVHKYGEKILAAPQAHGFNLLAYLMPVLGLGSGLIIVVLQLLRWRRAGVPRLGGTPSNGPSADAQGSLLRDQFEAELAAFDR